MVFKWFAITQKSSQFIKTAMITLIYDDLFLQNETGFY